MTAVLLSSGSYLTMWHLDEWSSISLPHGIDWAPDRPFPALPHQPSCYLQQEQQFLWKCRKKNWSTYSTMASHVVAWEEARVRGELNLLWCGGTALGLASFAVPPTPPPTKTQSLCLSKQHIFCLQQDRGKGEELCKIAWQLCGITKWWKPQSTCKVNLWAMCHCKKG